MGDIAMKFPSIKQFRRSVVFLWTWIRDAYPANFMSNISKRIEKSESGSVQWHETK